MKKLIYLFCCFMGAPLIGLTQPTQKPIIHAKHWVAITGKPLGATAGAKIFHDDGNAVDAACAMLAATCTMWDVLSWGGETQALIYNPNTKEVIGINALGVAPTGSTPEFYKSKGYAYPPQFGPLAAVTPGTPGGLMTMLAEYGTMSLAEILAPAIEMAAGYPMENQTAQRIEAQKDRIKEWPYSKKVFLTNLGKDFEAPEAGEIFVQDDLKQMLGKLVTAESEAIQKGKTRKEAIYAAYDRFYRGDIATEFVRGSTEQGGLITKEDLDNWEVYIEKPETTNYKGIDVYKLTSWVQGPVMLQALNMAKQLDLKSMGYNSANYIHALYQIMNMTFADRDFYYGDPYFPPEEPMKGLLSEAYAKQRVSEINWTKNNAHQGAGDPYPFQNGQNPFKAFLDNVSNVNPAKKALQKTDNQDANAALERANSKSGFWDRQMDGGKLAANQEDGYSEFPQNTTIYNGTTTIQAADEEGWVVSITPSGGWVPAVIAGRTGIGMSQRAQSFVLDESDNPYNVIAPGKRPRATLTPAMALKDGKPFVSMAVQGGDSQDQNLLQFFLNMVEFDMNVQEACEAANFNSFQLKGSFGDHKTEPGRLLIHESVPPFTRKRLRQMGYKIEDRSRTSGPINAIFFDWQHGSMWGGSSNFGEDYGIGW